MSFPGINDLAQAAAKDPTLYHMLQRSAGFGNGWGTNIPLLGAMVACARPGAVLELGGGYYSTTILAPMCKAMGRELVVLETAPQWAAAYREIHEPVLVQSWAEAIQEQAGRDWAVIFVDNQPDDTRLANLTACRELHPEFLVTHDTVNPYFRGVDEYLDTFKFRYDYTLMSSNTTAVSDYRKIPL